MPSLATITSGCAPIHSFVSSLRPWMMTQPPSSRYLRKVSVVSRSPLRRPLQSSVGLVVEAVPGIEEGGFDEGRPGRVGIGLRRDVESPFASAPDHLEGYPRVLVGARVHVDDVHRGAGDRGEGDRLLEGAQRAAGVFASQVDVGGHAAALGELEEPQDLEAPGV